jgi:hypothetical protein
MKQAQVAATVLMAQIFNKPPGQGRLYIGPRDPNPRKLPQVHLKVIALSCSCCASRPWSLGLVSWMAGMAPAGLWGLFVCVVMVRTRPFSLLQNFIKTYFYPL